MIKRIKSLFEPKPIDPEILQQEALNLLNQLLSDPKSECTKAVNMAARNMAGAMIMNWMDRRGVTHCGHCPSTDQLRKQDGVYFCKPHFEHIFREGIKESTTEKKPSDLGLINP